MKRKLAGMLCVCLLVGLSGCSTKGKRTAASMPAEKSFTEEESSTGQEGGLYLLSGETEQGLYHVGEYKGNPRICFVDYKNCEDTVLCSKPGCAHDTENCMGSPTAGKNTYFVYALQDGRLAYIESSDQDGAEADQVCLADADGNNRRVIATMQDQRAYLNLLCADQENLYLLQDYEEQQSQLLRVSLTDRTMEALWTIPDPVPQLEAADGRDLIWYSFSNNQEEIPPLMLTDDMTEEEVRQEEERYQAALDGTVTNHRVYRFSVDTGEEQELLTWTSSYGSCGRSVLWDSPRLYWTDSDLPGNLHWVCQDSSSGEIAIHWPEEIISSQNGAMVIDMEQMLEGKILLTVYGPWGMDLSKRYALEPDSGTLQEIPLRYISNASEKPVRILGKTETTLLVEFESQAHNIEYIDEEGLPAQTLTFSHRTGLISIEDFFAGRPNYREIQPLES